MAIKDVAELPVPSAHNWRTTDEDEINRRRVRAATEDFKITNLDGRHPIFSNFRVQSGSGMSYAVEIRDLRQRQFHCECVDFRINGLGTCKHVEATLLHLEGRFKRLFKAAANGPSTRLDVVPDAATGVVRLQTNGHRVPRALREWFDADGQLVGDNPEESLDALRLLAGADVPELRVSQELHPWLENRRRAAERQELRREYELKVQAGEWPAHETKVPLFPYQREGMLHLAFTERALLADEMGLGKTIQAIAACALLHRLGKAKRVLVVTPASLKTEWEEQIQRFTDLPYQLVYGQRHQRLAAYEKAPFFTIVNYEQMLADAIEVNRRLQPDVVILDEAQRIKNWNTKTTQAIKRLKSRYAFVLTGTPIENRIDEIHSLMDFLNPSVLGPLFRFNREFYQLDDRGRPCGFQNLHLLHERIRPYLLRRRKADVETELPARTTRNHFVPLSPAQQLTYEEHYSVVAKLANLARRRPLTQQEQERLMKHLAMMRMVCDTNYILDEADRVCPKLGELEKLLEECRDNPEVKVIIFSEWERMLVLVRALCEKLKLGYAWHTGSVPQRRRRAEINVFKSDPRCKVFLSTDSGATGLNLQNASIVVNCDLPWNPAKLEQRIARAWRKQQTRPVTVINLVAEKTIEHRMLDTLSNKQALADGVLELKGDLSQLRFGGGRQAFLAKLQHLVGPPPKNLEPEEPAQRPPPLPADRSLGFAQEARRRLAGALVRCEERYPQAGAHSVLYVVVERDSAQYRERLAQLHADYFGPGKTDPLSPVRLEIVDRAVDETLERLIEAGLVARTTRASRPLFPADPAAAAPPPLSEAEQAKIAQYRQLAARKLKMARLLLTGELLEEARNAFQESLLPLAKGLAVENRMPEPGSLEDALLPPLALHWKEALEPLRQFQQDAGAACQPALAAVEKLLPAAGGAAISRSAQP